MQPLLRRPVDLLIIAASLAIGLVCRWLVLDQVTSDTTQFLLPWYEFARDHGVASLGQTFTNYTPFYSYLLVLVTAFDGLAEPWHLIKAISFVFELGCAYLGLRLVALGTQYPRAPAIAFAAVWLAPTVLFNGGVWGQADALWTFFILLSVYAVCRGRAAGAVVSFGTAFAIKAQALFLGPFIFGLVLRRTIHWAWLAAVPIVYLLIAAPSLLLGQPLGDILAVYLKQADWFDRLSMNAANLWLFAPGGLYSTGVVAGLALAAVSGLVLAVSMARSKVAFKTEHYLMFAALALLLMPFVLPKMHDRYFFAFEVVAIILACLKPRLAVIALAAQLNGVMAYFAFYGIDARWLAAAALGNGWILFQLALYVRRRQSVPERPETSAFSPVIFLLGVAAIWGSYFVLLMVDP